MRADATRVLWRAGCKIDLLSPGEWVSAHHGGLDIRRIGISGVRRALIETSDSRRRASSSMMWCASVLVMARASVLVVWRAGRAHGWSRAAPGLGPGSGRARAASAKGNALRFVDGWRKEGRGERASLSAGGRGGSAGSSRGSGPRPRRASGDRSSSPRSRDALVAARSRSRRRARARGAPAQSPGARISACRSVFVLSRSRAPDAAGRPRPVLSGVSNGNRTRDNWSHNPVLYQLSYTTVLRGPWGCEGLAEYSAPRRVQSRKRTARRSSSPHPWIPPPFEPPPRLPPWPPLPEGAGLLQAEDPAGQRPAGGPSGPFTPRPWFPGARRSPRSERRPPAQRGPAGPVQVRAVAGRDRRALRGLRRRYRRSSRVVCRLAARRREQRRRERALERGRGRSRPPGRWRAAPAFAVAIAASRRPIAAYAARDSFIAAIGSRSCASNPAETRISSGAYSSSTGRRSSSNASLVDRVRRAVGQRHVHRVTGAFASAELVGGAGAGIERPLVQRAEQHPRIVPEDVLRAVAVMHVEVDDRHAREPAAQRRLRRHGDVVQETEAHAGVARGVVARRTEQRDPEPAGAGEHRVDQPTTAAPAPRPRRLDRARDARTCRGRAPQSGR